MGLVAGLDLNVCITSLAFSCAGSHLLAASNKCPKALLYETKTGVLIGSFLLTRNRLLEGILRELNSKYTDESGELLRLPLMSYEEVSCSLCPFMWLQVLYNICCPGAWKDNVWMPTIYLILTTIFMRESAKERGYEV